MTLSVIFYPYHFVRAILSVPFCPIPFSPYTILSVPFCPYHFVRYHFVRSPIGITTTATLAWRRRRRRRRWWWYMHELITIIVFDSTMSTLNGSTYRKTVTRSSVYSDSLLPERRNGFPGTPQPSMTYLEPPRADRKSTR